MKPKGSFPDLVERTRSAVVLVVAAAGAFWIGGDAVILLLAVTSALMSWEIASMYGENRAGQILIALIAALSFVSVFYFGFGEKTRLIFLAPLAATLWLGRFRSPLLCMIAIVAIIEISLALEQFSWQYHLRWTVWLIAVVAATDIGGYFAGRFIGGPKIFPLISPKKTWSGTVGGWVLAMVVSGIFLASGYGTPMLLLLTLVVSMASQAGDLAESSMKRRAGVKDSSNLIPGHGGLLDRFDGLLGACLAIGVISALGLLPALGISG